MILLTALLLLPGTPRLASSPPLQEPAPAEKPARKPRRAFPRLSLSQRHAAEEALLTLRTGRTPETRAAAADALVELGSGVVPSCLAYFRRIGAERAPLLREVLDRALAEADLDLAWKALGRKADPAARAYLVRRWADSSRKDAGTFLAKALADPDPEVRWQAARGLAWRGEKGAVPVLHTLLQERWDQDRDGVVTDFRGLPRGPLSGAVLPLLRRPDRAERLAAIRLFGLVGFRDHARVLKPLLDDPDRLVKLAAINACRAIIDGEPPLERPSVFRDIELAREWKERL